MRTTIRMPRTMPNDLCRLITPARAGVPRGAISSRRRPKAISASRSDADPPVQPGGDPVVAGSGRRRCRTTARTGVGAAAIEPGARVVIVAHPSSAPCQSPVR